MYDIETIVTSLPDLAIFALPIGSLKSPSGTSPMELCNQRCSKNTTGFGSNMEDNNNPLPLPHSPMFRRVWDEWVKYRRSTKKALSAFAQQKQLAMLGVMPEAEAIECINRSISNDWQGLFPEKKTGYNSKSFSKILTKDDHANGF